ncbi:serine hydrolase [Kitasatospora sp. NBC_00315]|uniref:serine hydrolase n=1 Tax=Kitasatospora sp. NBC_00315 TaxID=2975963 RepID=UPI00324CE9EC
MTSSRRVHRKKRTPPRTVTSALLPAVAAALLLGLGGVHLISGRPSTVPVAASDGAAATGTADPEPGATATDGPSATPTAVPSATATVDAAAAAQARATQAVARALATAGADAGGEVSVAVLDLASGVGADSGGSGHAFATASIVKADILAALLRQSGSDLTATQRTEAVAMIEQSDNDAAGALFDAVGGADGLDAANRAFGLTATTAGRNGYWGLTTTTAADQLRLLRVIFEDDSPLDADSRAYAQKLMGRISTDQDWGVSAADSGDGSSDAHWMLKNGWLSRSADGLWVINSIGRVTHDGRDVLVAVLSDGNGTEQGGISLVESVAVAAVDALTAAATD